ncbi:MAG: DUF5004 domain-containing protein [Sphingobacteriales bacterium]|jgi:hypothetical protein|nr:DUF5004 domain-containing protein [Sphingobacteriales bacterium]
MKKINLFGLIILVIGIISIGCKKPYDDSKEVATPISSPEKIAAALSGSWTMNTAIQVDEKSLVKESMNIADFLTSESGQVPNISFNTVDSTFTVDTASLVLNLFVLSNGKWSFDDNRYPSKIILKDLNGNVASEVSIGKNLLSPAPQLNFVNAVSCGAEKAMSYSISFLKNN